MINAEFTWCSTVQATIFIYCVYVLVYWFTNHVLAFGARPIFIERWDACHHYSCNFPAFVHDKIEFFVKLRARSAHWVSDGDGTCVFVRVSYGADEFWNYRQTEVTRWHSALNKAIEILLLVTAAAHSLRLRTHIIPFIICTVNVSASLAIANGEHTDTMIASRKLTENMARVLVCGSTECIMPEPTFTSLTLMVDITPSFTFVCLSSTS